MKARIKETGEVRNVEVVYLSDGYAYGLDEVEIIREFNPDKFQIDLEQRHFELVKAAMQGLLSTCSPGLLDKNFLAALSIDYANTVIAEYRKGGEE